MKYSIIIIVICIIIILYNINDNDIEQFINESVSTAYVINLDNRTDRWKSIQERFKNSSIRLERVSAIKSGFGHIGCAKSFQKVIKMAKEKSLATVLIFEDDNKPLEGYETQWNTIKDWLDSNLDKWDIFNGGPRFLDWGKYTKDTTSSPYENETQLMYTIDNNIKLFQTKNFLSANWLYINNVAYDKVLSWEYITKDNLFDRFLGDSINFKMLFTIPILALQESSWSDTDNLNQNFEVSDKIIVKIFNNILNRDL